MQHKSQESTGDDSKYQTGASSSFYNGDYQDFCRLISVEHYSGPQNQQDPSLLTWRFWEEGYVWEMSNLNEMQQLSQENDQPTRLASPGSPLNLKCIRKKKIVKTASQRKPGRPPKETTRAELQAGVKGFLARDYIRLRACLQNKKCWETPRLKWYVKFAQLPNKDEFLQYLRNDYDSGVLASSFGRKVKEELLAMQPALQTLIAQSKEDADLLARASNAQQLPNPLTEADLARISQIQAGVPLIFEPMNIRRTKEEISSILQRVREAQDIDN